MESRHRPAASRAESIDPSPPVCTDPQPRQGQRSRALHQAGTQSPESQPPSPNPSVPQQHPRLCNRWLGTAVRETLGETWMSTRRKTEIPRDFLLSKGVSYCLIFQEPESRQALLLSHWSSLKSRPCYKAVQMVNRQCQVHSSENVNSKKKKKVI